ncbi:MAG: hypothetical protein BECKG1743F_GA0114225_101014 [Candidatus Kentron sp. G]|nr:MAG: hypothetical protein BECKG1743F_GA0114225_101014 [Candidatus Kentron sp. G]
MKRFVAQDVRDFSAVLERRGPGLYRGVEVRTLPDAQEMNAKAP